MSWGATTIDALKAAGTLPLSIVLRVRRNAAGGGVGTEFLISSNPAHNPDALLLPESLKQQPAAIQAGSWRYSPANFSVDVVLPDAEIGHRSPQPGYSLRRGALVELLIGQGDDLSTYLPERRGRIQSPTMKGRHLAELSVFSLLYSLKGRPTPVLDAASLPQSRLFHGLCGVETTITTAGFVAGVGTQTLDIDDDESFSLFNGTGVAKITGDTGEVFYVTFTGVGSNQLTGVSKVGQFGTTSEDAAIGNTVSSVAYVGGVHPLIMAEQLLVSTGAGTNGARDVYPETAGFAIDQEWIDTAQFRMVRQTVVKVNSGVYEWEVLVESPVEDGLLWLQGLLNRAGIWLVERQGQIAVRAAQSLSSTQPVAQHQEITDADIIGVPTVEWYDPGSAYAYNRFAVVSATATATPSGGTESVLPATTLPTREEQVVDLSDLVFTNETEVKTDVIRRCDDYSHYPGEVITLTLRSAWWGLCEGDIIPLTTVRTRGRFVSTYGGYSRRACMVLSAGPNPIAGTTALKLLCMPLDPADDHG